jgi:cytochrome c oxidase subunit 1/cytochrome c oxidase subunit I+III
MAMTETRPEAAPDRAQAGATAIEEPHPAGGLAGILGTGSHAAIGRLWIGTSLVFLVVIGVLGGVLGAERLKTETYNILNQDNYAQTLSLHGVGGLFLFAIPILIGIAMIVVPRQVGADTVAFPRAAAASFWTFLVGGGMVVVSYLINGGPFGGNDKGVDLFLASLGMVVVALVLASVCLATTVLGLRTTGMSLIRVPLFAWSVLTAATIWIASLGLLFGLLVLLYLDHRYRLFAFGATNDIDRWLRWTMTPPQVFAYAIPVLGFAGDVVQVFTRTRARRSGLAMAAVGAFAGLSFGAWTYIGNIDNPRIYQQSLFVVSAFLIVFPVLMFAGFFVDTLMRGRPRLRSPLLFAAAALLMLLAGVVEGAIRAVHSLALVDTTADAAIAHYALGAVAIAAIGALHYWWPHVLTRPLKEGLGVVTALLLLVGVFALALPDLISGLLDERRGSLGAVRDGVQALNTVSFVGGVLVALAVVIFIANLAASLASTHDETVADPWDGQTLEWAADPIALTVESATPLLDSKEVAEGAST